MNNKILAIGSIIACIIILLASLSPVVGYNTVHSSAIDSPLFAVRTKRAIDQESDSLTCEYVGKNIRNMIFLPRRSNQIEKLSRAIDAISKMNDESFNNIVGRIVYQKEFINIETTEVIQTLQYMRANPDAYKHIAIQEDLRDYTLYFIRGFAVYYI